MRYFLLSLSLIWMIACQNDHRLQIETLTKETEKIHDEAMREMADMNRIARQLKKEWNDTTVHAAAERMTQIENTLKEMDAAEADMMAWMKNYDAKLENLQPEAAIQKMSEQKASIEKNQRDIRQALENGKKLLPAQ